MGIHIARTMLDEMSYDQGRQMFGALIKRLSPERKSRIRRHRGTKSWQLTTIDPSNGLLTLALRGSLDINNTAPSVAEQVDKVTHRKSRRKLSSIFPVLTSSIALVSPCSSSCTKGVAAWAGGHLEMKGVRDQPRAISGYCAWTKSSASPSRARSRNYEDLSYYR